MEKKIPYQQGHIYVFGFSRDFWNLLFLKKVRVRKQDSAGRTKKFHKGRFLAPSFFSYFKGWGNEAFNETENLLYYLDNGWLAGMDDLKTLFNP